MTFSPIETLTVAALLLILGYRIRDRVWLLDRLNIPGPVVGGLIAALVVLALRLAKWPVPSFDPAVQQPLMVAFFTSLGFGASFTVLKRGGPQIVLLLALASGLAILQGFLGAAIAVLFGLKPLYGVLVGTVTLSGGPATGLAFAPLFERAGVAHAATVATATAMAGIILASIFGAPIATALIACRRLDPGREPITSESGGAEEDRSTIEIPASVDGVAMTLRTIALALACMWFGAKISGVIQSAGVTLPAYIGAMLVAAAARNIDDLTGWLRLPHAAMGLAGAVALSLFLVMAMMTLDLMALGGLALPLLVNLAAQLALVALLIAWPIHWLIGRDYDAAVACGGFAGFMLGTTANAMAIMRALVEKYASAPRAFLVVPLVGAFLLDFTNSIIITAFLNIWGK